MASVNSVMVDVPPRSAVRFLPSAIVLIMALWICSASSLSSRWRSNITPLKIIAVGFARFYKQTFEKCNPKPPSAFLLFKMLCFSLTNLSFNMRCRIMNNFSKSNTIFPDITTASKKHNKALKINNCFTIA